MQPGLGARALTSLCFPHREAAESDETVERSWTANVGPQKLSREVTGWALKSSCNE